MSRTFVVSQLIGFIAWIIILFSYHRKDTNKILSFHIMAAILFCIHYYLLDAYSGFMICIFEAIRDFLYYITDKDNYIFLISIIFYILSGIFTYTCFLDVFPLIASFMDGYFLTKKKNIVVVGAIITYILWLVYDFHVKSFSGIVTDIIIIISNMSILLFKFNFFGEKNEPFVLKR